MSDIIDLKKRVARKKRDAKSGRFKVRDCRDAFFVIDDEYLNGYARVCGPITSMVYIALCRHVGKEQVCYPSHDRLAKILGISKSAVVRAIKSLEVHGLVRVDRKQGEQSIYTLTNKRNWRKGYGQTVVEDEHPKVVPMYCSGCVHLGKGECFDCRMGSKWEEGCVV